MFPTEGDPTGGMILPLMFNNFLDALRLPQYGIDLIDTDPEYWTETELKRWLKLRDLTPDTKMARAELLERVKANMRPQTTS
ncbi:hypothetical protein AYL99_04715 [Fonsecaea erecta]|uniref:Uncharacterized protein n=1 Tax=Fonsecaea erecta TaxID=1367422 RepID=A0A178ZRQ2_9EURO|nr:hypothetical protein AYL99_04715 [Fonsecaea erecta]OAP62510.1 hypothetical protein AYL99_04715 [Fonsecaea erecta]